MKVLVTGGCGFIGWNLCNRLVERGHEVTALDNMSAQGTEWRRGDLEAAGVSVAVACVRARERVADIVESSDFVFHLAAQTAVTKSMEDMEHDFMTNVCGTFSVVDAARKFSVPVCYNSTNKVYGDVNIALQEREKRWDPVYYTGVSTLDFRDAPRTPYGVSKACAGYYVEDLFRTHGVDSWDLRLSCVAGDGQTGTEDQGWVSWMILAALRGGKITIFGDGKQVRDVLNVRDLCDLYMLVIDGHLKPGRYDVGGGRHNTTSVWHEFNEWLEHPGEVEFADWRPNDQKWFASDLTRLKRSCGWEPRYTTVETFEQTRDWLLMHRGEVAACS